MADAPDADSRDPESVEAESQERRSQRGRLAVVGTIGGLVLIVGGFFIGRVSESESSDTPTTTTESTDTQSGDAPRVLTRACGKDAGPDAEEVVNAFPPIIVTDGAIEEQDKGSPGQALLEWWQAYQFDDLVAVEELTSQSTIDELGADNLAALVQLSGPGLQGIEILDVSESGNTATVNAGLLNFQPDEPGGAISDEPSNSVPETFAMEKEGGEWRFAQTDFLTLKLNSLPEDATSG